MIRQRSKDNSSRLVLGLLLATACLGVPTAYAQDIKTTASLPAQAAGVLGSTVFRTGEGIAAFAFSREHRYYAFTNRSGNELQVVETATGTVTLSIPVGQHAFAFSPHDDHLAYSDPEDTLRIVDLAHDNRTTVIGRLVRSKGPTVLAWVRAGTLVVYDGELRVVDVEKRRIQTVGDGFSTALASSIRNGCFSSIRQDDVGGYALRVWGLDEKKELAKWKLTVPPHFRNSPYKICAHPTQKTLITIEESGIREWDIATGKEPRTISKDHYRSGSFSPDGRHLALTAIESIVVMDYANWKPLHKLALPPGFLAFPVYSPDGKYIAAVSDFAVMIWEAATGKILVPANGHAYPVVAIAFTPDGKSLVSVSDSAGYHYRDGVPEFLAWTLDTRATSLSFAQTKPREEKYYGRPPHALAVSPNGDLIADSHDVWSLADGKWHYRIDHPRVIQLGNSKAPVTFSVNAAAISPDGKLFAGGGTNLHGLTLWSLAERKLIANLPVVGNPSIGGLLVAVYFTPDQRFVFAAYGDGMILRWTLQTPDKPAFFVRSFPFKASHRINSMTMTSDGKWLIVAVACPGDKAEVQTVQVVEAATGRIAREWTSGKSTTVCTACSPDGRLFATGGHVDGEVRQTPYKDDRTIRVQNLFTGEEVAKFEGHKGNINCLAWSPDGKTLASGSDDTTVLLWDVSKLRFQLPKSDKPLPDAEAVWHGLFAIDAKEAFKLMHQLSANGGKAVAVLGEQLRATRNADPKRIRELVAELDADKFPVRRAAARALAEFDLLAIEEPLRKALAGKPSDEARESIEMLLGEGKTPNLHAVRRGRALQVLEWIGSKAAKETIAELAKRPQPDQLAQEAKAALQRLEKFPR